jgi:hypothetical protein
MAANILKKATSNPNDPGNKYEKYNLKENPFPSNPFVSQDSKDKRYNGEIYESSVREEEERQIEENFLKVLQSNPNHIRLGYILDTSYVGRGNGKSSFAINLLKRINNQFCLDITNDQNKCFGLYIEPQTSGRTRNFSNFLDIWADAMFNSSIIGYAIASLRLEAVMSLYPDIINQELLDSEYELINLLNDANWYTQNNIYYEDVQKEILKSNNYYPLISINSPFRKRYSFVHSKMNNRIMQIDDLVRYYKELRKDSEKIDFIFNDIVNFFLASGFNGAYILVDDFERIPDFQSDRQKRDFALELRTNFFDGNTANARIGFYNLIIMLHAGVPRLIEKAWSESGMEQRSPISASQTATHIVYFDKLDKIRAISLIKKYLSEFRISPEDSIAPFEENAIAKIGEEKEYNAAKILNLAYMLLEFGVKENVVSIDDSVVNKFLTNSEIEVDTATTIMDENSEDLLNKASK